MDKEAKPQDAKPQETAAPKKVSYDGGDDDPRFRGIPLKSGPLLLKAIREGRMMVLTPDEEKALREKKAASS
ncbi:Hypothetical protein POVN_LOCUS159 [uncultured virus]|nr:Hypothetical protein POVN_LOCUS159 [uncultured virus]